MRISSGVAKDRKLTSPNVPGIKLTQEIVRGAIFAILFDKVNQAVCLDIYAGSGSIGLEALSRGAAWCDFVDINKDSADTIKKNIKDMTLSFETKSSVFHMDALKFIGSCTKKYDLIFMDPFYDDITYKHVFKTLPMIMNPESTLVFLHGRNIDCSNYLERTELESYDQRTYGATVVDFVKLKN